MQKKTKPYTIHDRGQSRTYQRPQGPRVPGAPAEAEQGEADGHLEQGQAGDGGYDGLEEAGPAHDDHVLHGDYEGVLAEAVEGLDGEDGHAGHGAELEGVCVVG